jgi:hypothetical protein
MRSRARCVLMFAGSLMLTACAALHIDVDVYKGPLANEPAIQDDQFPAMIPAAKALLVRLRRSLDPVTEKDFDSDTGGQGKWIANYPSKILGARAVNNILYLYEDEPTIVKPDWSVRLQALSREFADNWNLSLGAPAAVYSELASKMQPAGSAAAQCGDAFQHFLGRSYAEAGEWSVGGLASSCKLALQQAGQPRPVCRRRTG